ncbi:MAG: hypothetical protein KF871_07250 [Hydrogenophaga sp.]|uniref:hypothetical protein n=1 Tax=Hydrogenophaga sp. TaxID=1904254 RepID=UPI001D2E37B5|nr:hypothetical protein [Hydrogenophaga sp.]MBX3609680.1 hypothetical protein [Hydrogenophaga sp.]
MSRIAYQRPVVNTGYKATSTKLAQSQFHSDGEVHPDPPQDVVYVKQGASLEGLHLHPAAEPLTQRQETAQKTLASLFARR